MNKCETCWNSRVIISENGRHVVCDLPFQQGIACIQGRKEYYVKAPNYRDMRGDKE